jgi:hypothetical protein
MAAVDLCAERMTVAIVGPFGPAQLTCMRSWKQRGLRVVFIHITNEDFDLWFINHLTDGYLRLTQNQFLSDAGGLQICRHLAAQKVAGVATLSYLSIARLHALARTEAWPTEARVWATPDSTLGFLESKIAQTVLAEQCGFDVAPTAYLSTYADADSVTCICSPPLPSQNPSPHKLQLDFSHGSSHRHRPPDQAARSAARHGACVP